ncbi:hypothetical protein [Reinekea thalattae]|uniref:Uncharacterized protein n=1 Tax=Reinekea thalattae TaxID=2593301 RepID=A0A5C8Z2Y8_9GAMM|nr:hypothetical protein [Reinekea thalattae]TXR51256.1 hypothetical protein FME95_13540 [Reinekea thalattae]
MFLYLLALLIMSLGVSIVVFGQFKLVISRGHMSQYDAGGFYFIAQIVVIYLLVSLAYFWGETRFGAIGDDLHPSYIGVLFVLCSSLGCLGYGLHNLNQRIE